MPSAVPVGGGKSRARVGDLEEVGRGCPLRRPADGPDSALASFSELRTRSATYSEVRWRRLMALWGLPSAVLEAPPMGNATTVFTARHRLVLSRAQCSDSFNRTFYETRVPSPSIPARGIIIPRPRRCPVLYALVAFVLLYRRPRTLSPRFIRTTTVAP